MGGAGSKREEGEPKYPAATRAAVGAANRRLFQVLDAGKRFAHAPVEGSVTVDGGPGAGKRAYRFVASPKKWKNNGVLLTFPVERREYLYSVSLPEMSAAKFDCVYSRDVKLRAVKPKRR